MLVYIKISNSIEPTIISLNNRLIFLGGGTGGEKYTNLFNTKHYSGSDPTVQLVKEGNQVEYDKYRLR